VLRALGQLYFSKQDYVHAEEALEMATRLSPEEGRQAFLLLIELAIKHQNLERGQQYLRVMEKYFPEDSEVRRLQKVLDQQLQLRSP
jgi:uncharacterized protein HemY